MSEEQILLTLAYDGADYCGYQVQNGLANGIVPKPSVQATVQNALEAVYGVRLPVVGCSRTDAGVHARDFKLTYRIGEGLSHIPEKKLPLACNRRLPPDIAVLSAEYVPLSFHVRHDVYEKEYEYRICNTPVRDPFSARYAYWFKYPLDTERLTEAARVFIGRHDFRGFMASGSDAEDTVRTIHSFTVVREENFVLFRIAADGFLYNMVRILVGTMLAVAGGRIPSEVLPEVLASRDRAKAGMTVPACGLYLNRVRYSPADT